MLCFKRVKAVWCRPAAWALGLVAIVLGCSSLSDSGAKSAPIKLEGTYPGHLQDVWMSGDTIWWAHTQYLIKTDWSGKILTKAEVGGHHAGLEVKGDRLFSAVCAYRGESRAKTTPECHVMIGEYEAATLRLIEMHVLDINDRAGSFCFMPDGSMLVGCLRHPALKPNEVKFHHVGKDYQLIKTHIVDVGKPVKMGIEVIRRYGNDIYLFIYGGPVIKLSAETFAVTDRYVSFGGQRGFALEGTHAWIGQSRLLDAASGSTRMWHSELIRKPCVWQSASSSAGSD